MKTSVISEEFRERYLAGRTRERVRRAAPSCSTARTTITPASTIRRSASTSARILVIRGAGPLGWPGSAEVVNMQPPDALLKRGITSLPTIGDGRQSGTSDSPSILNASPESAAGGGLAWLRTGDIDPHRSRPQAAATCWSTEAEIARRKQAGTAAGARRAPRPGRSCIARRWASSISGAVHGVGASSIAASRARRRGTITEARVACHAE